MSRVLRLGFRFLTLIAIVAAASVLLPRSTSTDSPYSSAISDIGLTAVFAAPTTCNNKACGQRPTGLRFTCVDQAGSNCKTVRGGTDCAISIC